MIELGTPLTVIVLVAPVPVAVIFEPTKFKVVAAVDNDDPSSCTVKVLSIVIVLVEPVPEAVTPAPTKSNLVAAVDKSPPSSAIVNGEPLVGAVALNLPCAELQAKTLPSAIPVVLTSVWADTEAFSSNTLTQPLP